MSRSRDLLVTEVPHLRRSARVLARGEREAENLVQACLATQEKTEKWLRHINMLLRAARTRLSAGASLEPAR